MLEAKYLAGLAENVNRTRDDTGDFEYAYGCLERGLMEAAVAGIRQLEIVTDLADGTVDMLRKETVSLGYKWSELKRGEVRLIQINF